MSLEMSETNINKMSEIQRKICIGKNFIVLILGKMEKEAEKEDKKVIDGSS